MKWQTLPINDSINIDVIKNKQTISVAKKQYVENIWNKKKEQYPSLFNGRVFTVDHLEPNNLVGHWTEYKMVLAQMERPELYKYLNIRSLAVNGLIQCPDGFIIGKRSAKSVYLPNYWQSPPAGSVESRHEEQDIHLLKQLFTEVEEELGLSSKHFTSSKIISATEHEHTHIIDIGILLETNLSFTTIFEMWKNNKNEEYDELICVSTPKKLPDNTLPTTQYLIRHW